MELKFRWCWTRWRIARRIFFNELGECPDDENENGWRYDEDNLCNVVLLNNVDKMYLEKMKKICHITIARVKKILGIDRPPTINNYLEIFVNRDWYFLLENIINKKLSTSETKCRLPEVLELQRVWTLQMIEKQKRKGCLKITIVDGAWLRN